MVQYFFFLVNNRRRLFAKQSGHSLIGIWEKTVVSFWRFSNHLVPFAYGKHFVCYCSRVCYDFCFLCSWMIGMRPCCAYFVWGWVWLCKRTSLDSSRGSRAFTSSHLPRGSRAANWIVQNVETGSVTSICAMTSNSANVVDAAIGHWRWGRRNLLP